MGNEGCCGGGCGEEHGGGWAVLRLISEMKLEIEERTAEVSRLEGENFRLRKDESNLRDEMLVEGRRHKLEVERIKRLENDNLRLVAEREEQAQMIVDLTARIQHLQKGAIFATTDVFHAMLELFMCSDPWPASEDARRHLENLLNAVSVRDGYKNWIDAYDAIPRFKPSDQDPGHPQLLPLGHLAIPRCKPPGQDPDPDSQQVHGGADHVSIKLESE